MSTKLYKGKSTCTCDDDQLTSMAEAGWSSKKPSEKVAEAKPAEAKPVATKSSSGTK